jgi:hypothetical protein
MKENKKICPICKKRKIKKPSQKTFGDFTCMGKYAEFKTKRRIQRQKLAEPYIRKWADLAKRQFGIDEVCAVCGETIDASLTTHHFDKQKDPNDTVRLCGSCHRVFDSTNSGLRELKMRRTRYYKYNLSANLH